MNEPLETLYINNLNEKVSINTLENALRSNFEKYGTIIQITAHKSLKRKGQAFITFNNIEASKEALTRLQGHKLFDKVLKIDFAKSNSDNYFTDIKQESVESRKRQRIEKRAKEDERPKKVVKIKDWQSLPSHNILLAQNLKPGANIEDLNAFFEEFQGFINARFVKVRNLAFIEFDNENLSTECLKAIQSSKFEEIFGAEAVMTYAKK
ncbi:uncharacterized protein PRCAT00005314001 [Priceomyces carsonii]|uniref:uncharacterized protein n=1 Tax=Priceomyces carsonii TaxID=28549 RepID=UPI002ED95520|nr:unnamed protein product [Priceomyces carsonii]